MTVTPTIINCLNGYRASTLLHAGREEREDPRDLRCRVTVRKLPLAQQGQENGEREALGVEESCNTASIALTGGLK